MSKEDDMAEVEVEQGAAIDVDVVADIAVDVEEGEISDSNSVEEITQEDFQKQQLQEEEKELKGISAKTSDKDDPRVWAQVCDLYTKYPAMSRGYTHGLYHLAWAQAVQNKPLNDIFVMGVDPKSNEPVANSSSTSASSSSTSSRSPASVNEVNLELSGKDNNSALTSFGKDDANLVPKQQNHSRKFDQVVIDDSDDEIKLEPKPVYPEVLGIDQDQDKEEGELEEGEIDLETHTKANDVSPSQQGEGVEMRQPDEQQDLPMGQEEHGVAEEEQGKDGVLSPHTSHVDANAHDDSDPYSIGKDLLHYLNSIQEALDCVTLVNGGKSFGEACSQMQEAFFSLLRELQKCDLSTKEALIPLSFNTLEVVNSGFQSLDDHQKEEARDSFSRLLCLVKDQGTPIFSPEHMKEIQFMMNSLGSLDSLAILTTTAKDQMEVKILESDKSVGQKIASLSNLSVPMSFGECSSTAPSVVSITRGRGILLPLLDLHKDHDADSLPSPTREVQSNVPLSKAFSHGDVPAKLVSAKPKLDQYREDPRIRFYETEALKAVSTYQQRFGRNSFWSAEKLPSPTPSDNCDDGEIDTSEEVSSIPSVDLSKVTRPPAVAQAATSSAAAVNNFHAYGLLTSTNTAPLSSGYNSLKTSSKNRDPRLRFVNSDLNSLDLNRCLFPAPQNTPIMGSTEVMSLRKQKSSDELSSHGPVLKKQKNELESFVRVKTKGWLEDSNTGHSLTDRSQTLQAAETNSTKETGVMSGTSSALCNLNSASIGIEQGPVTSSNATHSLPALLKDVAVNPFMLANLLKMGQQRLVGESLNKSFDFAGRKTEPSASNPTLGAGAVVSAAPSTTVGLLQKSVGASPSSSSHAASGCPSNESTKIRMKPRDPRRILHGGTLQKSGSFLIDQFKSVLPPSSSSEDGGDNINGKKMESLTEAKPMLSQSVVAPDIARQFTKNLKSLADIVSVSQAAANLPLSAQNLSSVARPIKSDTDFRSNSRSEDQHAVMVASPESGVTVTPQSQCTWDDVDHLFEGYDEKQKAAIQRERARRIEEQRKMFAARKLCLVLDLDHTLLNSAKFGEVELVHEDVLRKKEEQDREKPHRHLFCFPHMAMWTKLRPGIWNFLEKASKLYELHLYTMGNKLYATEMAKVLDPKGVLFAGRVISKGDDGDPFDGDERVPKSKDLEGVLGMESAVVIIDDSVRVWPHNKLNLIVVERYTYFPCSRRQFGLHGPSLLEIDHDERPEDGTLASSLAVIERIHQNFFAHKTLEEADVRNILASEQRKILAGCRIVFSRVFPVGDANPHLHPLWQTAEQFGAICTNQIDEQVTHVVANSLGTDKVNWALSTGRYVVHPGWVEASALLYRRANELDFAIKP